LSITATAVFFCDQFQLEFYVRRLAENGVRLVSITQEPGDDPMINIIRQIMALFEEYQSRQNAKLALRTMKENARQGYWNGSRAPIGYRTVDAGGNRRSRFCSEMARPKGFEPLTPRFVVWCSIQLSYGRMRGRRFDPEEVQRADA
jgi:hypothetical protein